MPSKPMRMGRAEAGDWRLRRQLSYIDKRKGPGRFAAALRQELLADQGPDPSAARVVLVDMAVFAATWCSRLVTPFLARGEPLSSEQLDELHRWQGELRKTLQTLGLDRVEAAPPSVAKLLADDARLGLPPF